MVRNAICVVSVLVVAGCDLGGGSSEKITQAAYTAACNEARDQLVSQYSGSYFVQALCAATAVENNTDAEACGDEFQSCIENPPAEIQAGIDAILAQGGCNAITIDPDTCESTVGRLKDCLEDIDSEISGIKYTLTCAAAGQTLSGWDIVGIPASCQTLEQEC